MTIYRLGDRTPQLEHACFVAEQATIVGDVIAGVDVNIWFSAVLRGDNEPITLGDRSNVQDGVVMHTDPGCPLVIGNDVSIGHQATVHGCQIGDGSLIGMQAVVLNNARIGANCLVGAGALITERKEFPDGSLIVGAPARVLRPLKDEEIANLHDIARRYVERGKNYAKALVRIDDP